MKNIDTISKIEFEKIYKYLGSISALKKEFGCGFDKVKRKMIEFRVNINTRGGVKQEINIDRQELYSLYSTLTINEIATQLKCDHSKVSNLFNKYKITHKPSKRYIDVNEEFFSKENIASLYWLGFIAADGCISNNRLSIELAQKDKQHLEKFKQNIESKHKLLTRTIYNSKRDSKWKNSFTCGIRIGSKKICSDLAKYGLAENKSLTMIFPKQLITNTNIHIFIRGYFDGDGSWYIPKNRNKPVFVLCGTKSFLTTLSGILLKYKVTSSFGAIHAQGKIHVLRYYSDNAIEIARWMYAGSGIYLDRKKNIVSSFLDY